MTAWASDHLGLFVLMIIVGAMGSKYIWFALGIALDDIEDYCLRYGATVFWSLLVFRNLLVFAVIAAIILLFFVNWPLACVMGAAYAYLVIKKFFPFFGLS